MIRAGVAAVFLAGSALVAPAAAQTVSETARRFGALESVQHISLSPSGSQVAFIRPVENGRTRLFIANLAGDGAPRAVFQTGDPREKLYRCKWATEAQLVCSVQVVGEREGDIVGYTRQLVVSSDGKTVSSLSARTDSSQFYAMYDGGSVIDWDLPGKPGRVLMERQFVPRQTVGSNIKHEEEGLGVEEVDLATLQRRVVEKPRVEAAEYITDGHGTVRVMGIYPRTTSGYLRDRAYYSYRPKGSREWKSLSQIDINMANTVDGFEPWAVDAAADVAYGFDNHQGFKALFSAPLDGTARRDLVLSRPDVDVDGLVRIGRDRRVVGASYATERRTVEYFDPELRKLAMALGKALPAGSSISFVDASEGERQLLLLVSSDVDPGMFYRYDKATRQLSPLVGVRDELAGIRMGEMRPVTFPAADGTMIPGYLTLPPGSSGKGLPAIVMPHGGPSARDEWGFDWLVQYFVARGYAVLQPNYRGSSGYGSAWYQKNGFQSWRTAIGDVNDAGRWLLGQGIAAPGKLSIVGWSYGGYAALQSQVLAPDLFGAVVAIAPVTDLGKLRQDSVNRQSYRLVDAFIGEGPHVKEGSPALNARSFKAPVLMFHGTYDQNVSVDQARLMEQRLRDAGKAVTYVEFPALAHAMENSEARARVLAESDAFLRKALGLPQD